LTYPLRDHRLLPLLLKVKLDLILTPCLHLLCRVLLAQSLKLSDLKECWLPEKPHNERIAHEHYPLFLPLNLFSELWQEREVDSGIVLFRVHEVEGLVVLEGELDLKVEDLLVLLLGLRGELLVVVEEAGGCGEDLELVDAPLVAEFLQDLVLVVQDGDRALMGNVVETDDTVGDALGLD